MPARFSDTFIKGISVQQGHHSAVCGGDEGKKEEAQSLWLNSHQTQQNGCMWKGKQNRDGKWE